LNLNQSIFNISSEEEFDKISLEVFKYQYINNIVYQQFCNYLKLDPKKVSTINQIPFLPIEFFKTHQIISGDFNAERIFLSSGTTGAVQSKHYVKDIELYETSFIKAFDQFYGDISEFCILALLPSYMDREGSSLIYMVEKLIKLSNHHKSGFFLKNESILIENLKKMAKNDQKTILIGVSFALLDLAEAYHIDLNNVIIMETGGMKGRREELTRNELHNIYKKRFNVTNIHSEYGMTELLSQAYSNGDGIFNTPSWMKILIRDINDPLTAVENNKTGGINVIDLANINSCSFIATKDLGKKNSDHEFEVLGRFDNSDIRGCNLLLS
jgi:phenylacetate-coenzyme A ligase PaaK-like adenylate-forming protein